MGKFIAMVVALLTNALPMPAQAFGTQFCDDIADPQSRMACLQEHITHLEQTVLALSGRVAALEMELKEKLSAGVTYRLRFSEQHQCLGVAAETQSPVLVACDKPNSWTLLVGVPINKRGDPASTNKLPPVNSGALPPEAAAPTPVKSCQSLDKDACIAHPESCFWRTENNKCGRKKSENQANQP